MTVNDALEYVPYADMYCLIDVETCEEIYISKFSKNQLALQISDYEYVLFGSKKLVNIWLAENE